MRNPLVLLVLSSALSLLARGQNSAKSPSFKEVVELHFKAWDTNRDGALDPGEIDKVVKSRAVKGEAAAAAASIHVWFRNHHDAPKLTLEMLASAKDGATERRDLTQKSPHFSADYTAFNKHLAKVPRQIFASEKPSLVGMSQGHLGDCFFVSTVGALVHRNPAELRHLIHPGQAGECEITFGENRRAKVEPLSDGLICLGSTAHEQGLWLNYLEEGYGQIRHTKKALAPADPALDRIAKGGDAGDVIELLTGHKAETLHPKKMPHARVQQAMTQAAASRLLMCAGTPGGMGHKLPPGIPGDHDYAVLDVKGGHVTLWNPWGNHFTPKRTPAGLEHGYPVESGVFTMPFGDFCSVYGSVFVETRQAVRKR